MIRLMCSPLSRCRRFESPCAVSAPSPIARSLYAHVRLRAPRRLLQIGQHGFAGDHPLSGTDQRRDAIGQVDIDPTAEADHADPFARAQA